MVDRRQYEAALAVCQPQFEQRHDTQAGLALARAHYALGHDAEALGWPQRLAGSPEEGAAWDVAADVHRRRQEPSSEKEARLKALALHRGRGDLSALARCHYAIFYASWEASDYLLAFNSARDAYDSARAGNDRAMARKALEGLFAALYEIGDLEGARAALARLEGVEAGVDREAAPRFWTNVGALRMAEGRWNLARHALETAVRSLSGGEQTRLLRSIHLNLAEVELERGDLDGAGRQVAQAWRYVENDTPSTALLFDTARLAYESGSLDAAVETLDRARRHGPVSDWEWDVECLRGRVEERLGHRREALEAYDRSTRIVDRMRAEASTDEFKAWLLDRRREPFERLFALQAAHRGGAAAALATAERAKARGFLDSFVRASAEAPSGAAWDPASSFRRLEFLHESFRPGATGAAARPRRGVDLLRGIGGRQVLLFFEARPNLWLIRAGGGRVALWRLGPAAEVERLADRLVARPDDAEAAEALGRRLFPPGSLPARGTTLSIVTDGPLDHVPLAAVRAGGRFLAQDYLLSYAPGVDAVAAIEGSGGRLETEATVLGDPRGDLPAAQAEAREIARGLGVTPLIGGAATVESFRSAHASRLLHVASHVENGPAGPRLVLADGTAGAAEIMRWRVRPRVVVLAGCLGAARLSRGAWGSLSAAFLAAGARSVVAALPSVEDRAAREFLSEFYRQGGARDPARALALAQRTFIAAGRPPSFWSPFVALGAGRPLRATSERKSHAS